LSWNSYWRAAYEKVAKAIDRQADELIRSGTLTVKDATEFAVAQRNALVVEMRKPLTPFGKFYSETLKPAKNLPTLAQFLARKGSL
jgi:hypothetical protein